MHIASAANANDVDIDIDNASSMNFQNIDFDHVEAPRASLTLSYTSLRILFVSNR